MKIIAILLTILLILSAISSTAAELANSTAEKSSLPVKKAFIPPGFELLLEPQTTQVDIFYGGQYLLSTLARFTPTEITFLAPGEIVARIPELLTPEIIRKTLSNPLSTNSELVCLRKEDTGCGTIATEDLAIIFDNGKFRVDLFVSSDLISVRTSGIDKYLPASDAGFSFLNAIGAAANGEKGGNKNYNVANTTILSFAENRLFALSNVTREEGYTVDTLALQRDLNGLEYQLGIFRARAANLVFIREADFKGASIASSLNTRRDLDQSSGSELQLFLDSKSRVDIFKDGRLISSSVYDTGNQVIDTSELPSGAYDVVLRIRDAFGRLREETRFYIKTNRLPPVDQTLFFFDAGELVQKIPDQTLPETTGISIIRTGVSRRITKNFGGEIGVLVQEDDSLIETGFFKLGRNHELRTSFAYSDRGDWGVNLNSRFRAGPVTFTSNLRKTWVEPIPIGTPIGTPPPLLGEELTQTSVGINAPLAGGFLHITSRYIKRPLVTDRNLGIKYNFASRNFGSTLLDSNIQLTKDNDNYQFLLTFSLRFHTGRWQTEYAPRIFSERKAGITETDFDSRLSTTWQDGEKYQSDVSFSLRASEENATETVEANMDLAGSYGRSTVDVLHTPDTDSTNYGANLFTTIIANSSTLSFGGKSLTHSALVMDIEGETQDAYFDVFVNNSKRGSVNIGKKSVVSVHPFDTYEVSLQARGDSLLDFNHQGQTATLYPGNVVTMKWKAARVIIAFGQILDVRGNPVANALIKGVTGIATTDEFGLFQAEIEAGIKKFEVQTRKYSCNVQLPEFDSTSEIALLGELTCL